MIKCPRCGISLSSEQCLEYHLLKKKTPCNKHSCINCNKIFKNENSLKIHKVTCQKILPKNKISLNIDNDILYFCKNKLKDLIIGIEFYF